MTRLPPPAALALLLATPALAAVSPQPQPQPQPGVYKHRFANADVQGDSFTSENILEVVPYRPRVDYVRLHLEFFNGHMCDISGMARFTPTGLLYDGPKDPSGHPCELRLEQRGDGVHVFEDQTGACRAQTCGARGGYGWRADQPADFTTAERRTIRYMPKLLASSEYKAAAAAYMSSGGR